MSAARNLAFTESQAIALRYREDSQPKVAIETKLAPAKTATALRALARLRLAEHDQTKRWHATWRRKTCPGEGAATSAGGEIAEKLQI
jgi:hypothetical protein